VGFLKRASRDKSPAQSVDQTALAREQLRSAGADLDMPHETRHFLYVPGVKSAQTVARALRRPDRRIEIETSARTGYWLVVVIQPLVITPDTMGDLRAELVSAAAPVGGEYDSWQVAIANG
jgi:hypothetical protein